MTEETKLYFSKEEKRSILQMNGYIIEQIDSFYKITYNREEIVNCKVVVCFLPEHRQLVNENVGAERTVLLGLYGTDSVFSRFIKFKITNLLTNK